MKTNLILKFEFIAAHSLENYEEPHDHLWKIEATFTGDPVRGKIIDLIRLRSAIDESLAPLKKTFLNENASLPQAARAFPTCENLGEALFERFNHLIAELFLRENPSVRVVSVGVTLCDTRGIEQGAALVTL